MTATARVVTPDRARLQEPSRRRGRWLLRCLTTTDHKLIGAMYMGTAMAFFAGGGVLALVMLAEVA